MHEGCRFTIAVLRLDRAWIMRTRRSPPASTLEATQGKIDGFFSQLQMPPELGGICVRLT